MARVTSRCMLCYRTRSHYQRQGPETLYLLLSSYPTHTCILESLSQELKIILQMVCACMCMCVHLCVCLCVPTNPHALAAFPSFSFKNYLLATAQGTLLNVKWQPGWEGSLEENDPWICVVESLPCLPETVTTLLMGYCYCLDAKPCLTLCDSMDSSLPGSSVYEISRARILECIATSFSRGSS